MFMCGILAGQSKDSLWLCQRLSREIFKSKEKSSIYNCPSLYRPLLCFIIHRGLWRKCSGKPVGNFQVNRICHGTPLCLIRTSSTSRRQIAFIYHAKSKHRRFVHFLTSCRTVTVRPERSGAKSKASKPASAPLFDFAAPAATLR